MAETTSFDFDNLKPVAIPVKYQGRQYILRTPSADAVRQFKNAQLRGARLGKDGEGASPGDMADGETVLIAGCLFESYECQIPGQGLGIRERPVTLQQIRQWDNRVIEPLFERAMEIAGLRVKDKATKNPQEDSENPDPFSPSNGDGSPKSMTATSS